VKSQMLILSRKPQPIYQTIKIGLTMESNQMNSPDFLTRSKGKDNQIEPIRFIDFLTIEQNVYLKLCYPGKTISEISALTGIHKNTVRWYITKGVQIGKVFTTR